MRWLNIKLIRAGYSRDVLLIGKYAFKFPSPRNGWRAFVMGLLGNIEEARKWQYSRHTGLAPVLFSLAGFVNIYPRYEPLEREITETELTHVAIFNPDRRSINYARDENGDIIVLDYGHCDAWIKAKE